MWWLALKALLALCALGAAGAGCGAWIAGALPRSTNRAERAGISLLGGLGLFSLALFLIGQVSFTRTIIVAALSVAILLAIRPLWRARRELRAIPRTARGELLLPGLIVALVLAITAIAGTAEMTGDWGQDAIAYHLVGPKVWLREGVIRPVPDNSYTAFPQIPETLFAVLMEVGGNRAPDFSSWLTLGLLLLVAAGLGMRVGLTAGQAWWVAAIVAAMPAVYTGAHACFIDALYAAFVLAAARIGFDARSRREWAVFGMFCGLAMGTKYTGVLAFFALAVCCVVMVAASEKAERAGAAKGLGLAVAVAGALASPFYIRNWIVLGCPIYPPPPGYEGFCSPKYFSREALQEFHEYIRQRGIGMGRGFFAFLELPFNLTYHTANFNGAGGIGLCPLGLAPFGIVALRRERFAKLLLLFGLLLTCLWFVTEQESRFLVHVYVLGAVFAVAGWSYVADNGGKLARGFAAALVAVSISYGLFMIERAQASGLRAVFSPQYAALRREREIPYLASFEYINSEPDVRKVLILDRTVPAYYCDKPYLKPVGQWDARSVPGAPTSLEALQHARELGVTDVLDVVSSLSGFQVKTPAPGLKLVFAAPEQRIYRVQ
ncbi:MAG: hypothetical protein WA192_02870 [Candidatus Acidiferrales bacterium]